MIESKIGEVQARVLECFRDEGCIGDNDTCQDSGWERHGVGIPADETGLVIMITFRPNPRND